jgi:hypothetical protein
MAYLARSSEGGAEKPVNSSLREAQTLIDAGDFEEGISTVA